MPRVRINGQVHWVPLSRIVARPLRGPWRYFLRFANRPPSQTAAFTGITVALVLIAFTFPPTFPSAPLPPTPSGWTSFHSAEQMIQSTVAQEPGGPWTLSLAEGVAASATWAPSLSMWAANASLLSTIIACQSSLSGPSIFTFWSNSLYPTGLGLGSLETGAAGLWTFVYLNSTGAALVDSVLAGHLEENGLVANNSACISLGGPFQPTTSYLNPANVSDPSSFAASSFGWYSYGTSGGSTTAYYILGNPVVPVAYTAHGFNQEWSTYYGSCGDPGVNGIVTYDSSPQAIPGRPGYQETVTFGDYCYQTMIGVTNVLKALSSANGTYYAKFPLVVNPVSSGATTPSSLTTADFDLEILLNSTTGPYSVQFNSGTPGCKVGAASLADCPAPYISWYAALLNPSGVVVNTFPSYGGSGHWTVANTTVVSGDTLAVVSAIPVFSLPNSGVAFVTSLNPYVCCGMPFGPITIPHGPTQL
jgi:hypothetical protein